MREGMAGSKMARWSNAGDMMGRGDEKEGDLKESV